MVNPVGTHWSTLALAAVSTKVKLFVIEVVVSTNEVMVEVTVTMTARRFWRLIDWLSSTYSCWSISEETISVSWFWFRPCLNERASGAIVAPILKKEKKKVDSLSKWIKWSYHSITYGSMGVGSIAARASISWTLIPRRASSQCFSSSTTKGLQRSLKKFKYFSLLFKI